MAGITNVCFGRGDPELLDGAPHSERSESAAPCTQHT